jgi:hypothetical protein
MHNTIIIPTSEALILQLDEKSELAYVYRMDCLKTLDRAVELGLVVIPPEKRELVRILNLAAGAGIGTANYLWQVLSGGCLKACVHELQQAIVLKMEGVV